MSSLALSTAGPTWLTFSLLTLASRGGATGSSRDGWASPYARAKRGAVSRTSGRRYSPLVRHLETQGPRTRLAISHIRHATRGAVSFWNTYPFVRELGGRQGAEVDFIHNISSTPASREGLR